MKEDSFSLTKAKRSIDLVKYIEQATGMEAKKVGPNYIMNPCPVCGHKDHFSINPRENLYNSFSQCIGGGSIIDFMVHYEHLSLHDAIKKTLTLAKNR